MTFAALAAVATALPATAAAAREEDLLAFDHWELGLLVVASLVLYNRWSVTRFVPPPPSSPT